MPNDYLFTEYRKTLPNGDKMEKWDVYGHALRDFMSTQGGYGLVEAPARDKLNITKFYTGVTNEVTPTMADPPITFYHPHDPTRTRKIREKGEYDPITRETQRLTDKDFITRGSNAYWQRDKKKQA